MHPDFWHERWAANQIGFHQQEPNRYLAEFWRLCSLPPGSRILLPLCGKSLDMLWLHEREYRVAGIEISKLAVAAFFDENGLQPVRHPGAGHTRWSTAGIDIYCGDFFALTSRDVGPVDGFFDRAALIALPAGMRSAYVMHLSRLLAAQSCGLLVTLEYDEHAMDGPPFSVSPGEVSDLLRDSFASEHLLSNEVLDAYPGFKAQGLRALHEHVFRLTMRASTRSCEAGNDAG